MNKGVCFECPKRIVGCHSKCEKYLAEKEQKAKAKADIIKQKNEDDAVKDVLYMYSKKKNKNKIKRRVSKRKRFCILIF